MIENITANHEIPNNWIWVDLDQLCDITSGNPAPQNKKLFKNGNVPFVRVQDMGRMGNNVYLCETRDYLNNDAVAKNNMKLFPKGSVLFTKSGMSILLNQRAILGLDMHVVSHIGICLPTKFTSSEWIYYWLKSIDFKDLTHATTLPSLKLSKVQKIRIPLPPLPEHHRIVAKIEELFTKLDTGAEALKQVQAQLKRYRQSVLKAAVEGRLTAEWREQHKDELEPADKLLERIQDERKAKLKEKYKEPIPVDSYDLPELPSEWIWVRAEQISDFITKGVTPSKEKLYSNQGEVPFVKVYNLTFNGKLDFSIKPTFITKKTHLTEMARSVVYPCDLLMNIVGPPLGKISIVPNLYSEWNINQAIARFRFLKSCNVKYYMFVLMYENILSWAKKRSKATAGQFNLTLQICRELPLPLPPEREQARIVEILEKYISIIDESQFMLENELKRAQSLRQSILKRAFEGKLVPQDPNDLPASALLERIKAEKTKSEKSKQMEMF